MNPEKPSRAEIEARITALLLGELPAEEAALLRWTISQDAALKKLHDELQSTIVLVREAKKNPADEASEPASPLKLSDERRQKLLAHFKTPRPKDSFWIRPLPIPSLIPMLVVVAIVALLAAMMLPALSKAKNKSARVAAASLARQKALEAQIQAEENPPAAGPATPAPDVVTVAPAPVIAPPAAQIVLPPAESSALAYGTVTTGSLAGSGSVFSQNMISSSLSLTPTTPTDSFALQDRNGDRNRQVTLDANVATATPAAPAVAFEMIPPGKPANTLVQDGKLLYEMGKLDEADAKLAEAVKQNPDNAAAYYYQNQVKQSRYARDLNQHSVETQARMEQVEKRWQVPPSTPPSQYGSGPTINSSPGTSAIEFAAGINPATGLAVPLADADKNDASHQNRAAVVGTVNAFGGVGGLGNTGTGGGSGSLPPARNVELARDASNRDRSGAPHSSTDRGVEMGPTAPAGTAGSTFQQRLPETDDAQPTIVLPELVANDSMSESLEADKPVERKYGSGTETTKGVSQLRNTPPASEAFKSGFSGKITPLPGHRAPASMSYDGIAAALPEKPAAPETAWSLDQRADQKAVSAAKDGTVSFDTPVASAAPARPAEQPAPVINSGSLALDTTKPSVQQQLDKSDVGGRRYQISDDASLSPSPTLDQVALQRINTEIQDTDKELKAQTSQLESLKSLQQTDPLKLRTVLPTMYPDTELAGMLNQLHETERTLTSKQVDYATNSLNVTRAQASIDALNKQIDGRVAATMAGLETQLSTTKASLDTMKNEIAMAKQTDFENAVKYQPYYAEKSKLLGLEETHKLLGQKLNANSIDAKIPATSMVQITDPAQPSKKQTFWQGLKGEYASTATMKVENDGGIVRGMYSQTATAPSYDPYFIQTTEEIMKSDAVLGQVVDAMKLDQVWSTKSNGEKLTKKEAIALLKARLDVKPVTNTKLLTISATSSKPEEAADIANNVAEAYKNYRTHNNQEIAAKSLEVLQQQYTEEENQIRDERVKLASLEPKPADKIPVLGDIPVRRPPANAPVSQPEILTRENAFSTFSLNVSDVSFKLAAASLEKGQMPDAASIRSEEFINAFDYRDLEAAAGQPLAFASERARYPFTQNRDLLRFSIKTAAAGRPAGRALNLVLLLDNSGSMERADRVAIIREALHVLSGQLQPQDTVSVVTFARTARLWADGVAGDKAGETLEKVGDITPEGGTNLEEAMRLAYETARRHYLANGMNRVVLLTDGAANLGNVDPAVLKQKVEDQRKQGIALDCFGIGFEDYDDDLLEQLSRHGDGRYAFINSPDEVDKEFAAKLAGALQIAASDVKVQVEFNPQRVTSYRQIGYAKHQLTKEQFRDNTVDAAEIAAQEAGNALYTVETKPDGTGPVATVHVRYKIPGTTDYRERSWDVAYENNAVALAQSSAAMRLAATASAFSEWLAASPYAQEVTLDELLKVLNGVPEIYGADERPKKLEWMIRQAKSLSGK